MIAYWDLWPWIVAEGAGEMALAEKRIEAAFSRIETTFGLALYPVMRRFVRAANQFLAETA